MTPRICGSAMPGWALGQRSTASSRGAGIALLVRGAEFLGREVAHGDVAAVEEQRRLGHAAAAWHRLALHAKADLQLRRDFAGDGLQLVKIGAGDVGVAENEADDPGIVEEEILGPLDLGAVRARRCACSSALSIWAERSFTEIDRGLLAMASASCNGF